MNFTRKDSFINIEFELTEKYIYEIVKISVLNKNSIERVLNKNDQNLIRLVLYVTHKLALPNDHELLQ